MPPTWRVAVGFSTPSKNVVLVSGKRKTIGSEVESGTVLHPKIVTLEIGDESDEESMALQNGNGEYAGK